MKKSNLNNAPEHSKLDIWDSLELKRGRLGSNRKNSGRNIDHSSFLDEDKIRKSTKKMSELALKIL